MAHGKLSDTDGDFVDFCGRWNGEQFDIYIYIQPSGHDGEHVMSWLSIDALGVLTRDGGSPVSQAASMRLVRYKGS